MCGEAVLNAKLFYPTAVEKNSLMADVNPIFTRQFFVRLLKITRCFKFKGERELKSVTPFNFNCCPWEKFLWCSFKNPLMSLTNEIQLLNVNLVYWSRRLRFARSFYFMAETWKGKPIGWKLPRARCLCSAIMRQESPALFMTISANISIKKTSLCPCLPLPREGEDKIVIQWNLTLVKGAGLFSMNKILCQMFNRFNFEQV